jgi:glycosyltransferase involved in cell wall biosynthesis
MSIRVLHLNSLLTGGGTDDQCVKLAAELRRLGHDASIAGPPDREFAKTIAALEIPHFFAPPNKIGFVLAVAKRIRAAGIQIVHGHHGRDLWPTILAAKLSGCRPKIVLTRHLAKSPSSWFSRQFLLGQCDAVIAVSNFVAQVLRQGVFEPQSAEPERRARPPLRGDHEKIHVIHGAIDTNRFRPFHASALRTEWKLPQDNFVFAVAGGYTLPRGKGQREFLVAAGRVHEKIPRARFLIVGRGNMAKILRADIERLGLTGKAWLTPYCQEMPQAMNAIDCLVHPQIGTEALGLVVCEAHACGKPVIASALDGIPEAFAAGQLGQLVEPESIDALATAMVAQAAAAPLSGIAREDAHARVAEKFSLPVMAANVARLYRNLLDKPTRS